KQFLVERQFCGGAALVLETTPEEVARHELKGAMAVSRPTLFELQLQVSKRATAGKNVFFGGDSVANGSFTQGAGNMIALVMHTEHVKQYLFDVERGIDPDVARESYNTAALTTSFTWGALSI